MAWYACLPRHLALHAKNCSRLHDWNSPPIRYFHGQFVLLHVSVGWCQLHSAVLCKESCMYSSLLGMCSLHSMYKQIQCTIMHVFWRYRVLSPSDSAVHKAITREELAHHWKQSVLETTKLIKELLPTFYSATDTLGVPLSKSEMKDIWTEQKKHIKCIQDILPVQLYTLTGHVSRKVECPFHYGNVPMAQLLTQIWPGLFQAQVPMLCTFRPTCWKGSPAGMWRGWSSHWQPQWSTEIFWSSVKPWSMLTSTHFMFISYCKTIVHVGELPWPIIIGSKCVTQL